MNTRTNSIRQANFAKYDQIELTEEEIKAALWEGKIKKYFRQKTLMNPEIFNEANLSEYLESDNPSAK